MSKQKDDTGAAAANLQNAREQLRNAEARFDAANMEYLDIVRSKRNPLELLDELEGICPMNEADWAMLQRYGRHEISVRTAAITEILNQLRHAIERTTT